ncbi:PucR family transcriptional regulator [Paenibacillus gallinarum]|uniref:PucR family transcriptional regulator n=1 Tax=Paenibacillus gallinarum TaxID=2762232 RepID=A0ABR8T3V1_9BACL|nr:PucR family transcriptional regulator [Paenibacillus gallinarum]MBD7970431.1 PucR family transcriptional regulator [Paenibacillus gallinarum]
MNNELLQSADTEFTCADILRLPHLVGIRLRAGEAGLRHPVTHANVMEVPDISDWAQAGEFLMTTGYPFRNNPAMLSGMIPKLVEKGVAALGVKTKRFIAEIPEDAIELAEKYGFPIFELPPHTVFSEVQRETMERVLAQETEMLSILHQHVQQLSQLMLEGKPLDEFIACLEAIMKRSVALFDDSGLLYASETGTELEEILEGKTFGQWIDLGTGKDAKTTVVHEDLPVRTTPIHANGRERSAVLFTADFPIPHSKMDILLLERVRVLIGMELSAIRMRREIESKYMDQFLQDWLLGRIPTEKDIHMRAEASGFCLPVLVPIFVILARPLDQRLHPGSLKQAVIHLRSINVAENTQKHHNHIHGVVIRDQLVFIAAGADADFAVRSVREELALMFSHPDEPSFSLCTGKGALSLDQVQDSYQEAVKVALISVITGVRQPHVTMEQLGIYRLLYLLSDEEEASSFRDQYIEPLAAYDSSHGSSLLLTATTYLEYNLNAKKTAAALFTHYNTVMHRLERIEELLQISFDLANDRLQLEMAIKLYAMQAKFSKI